MSAHEEHAPVKHGFFTPGTIFLIVIVLIGLFFGIKRYIFGIEAVANINDFFPWGIWKAVNVAAVAALGSSGFTLTAIVHIFHKEKYHSLMRPSLVVALLCYAFVGVALLVDLGRYYFLWHPMMPSMWQVNSALFEVAMCVMCYLTVLQIEFAPVFFERFIGKVNLPGPLAAFNRPADSAMKAGDFVLGKLMPLFMILGIVLCCLHQSTLGTLMTIPMYKMHPLWFSPALPMLFLLSATAVGLTSAIAASLWTSKAFGTPYEMKALTSLSKSVPIFMGMYIAARIIDLALRDSLGYMFDGSPRSFMFLAEFLIGVVLPCLMFLFEKVRRSPALMFTASIIFILGISFNRINTYLTAYVPQNVSGFYFPTFGEIMITLAQIATIILLYRIIVLIFPIVAQPSKNSKDESDKNSLHGASLASPAE